MSGAGNGGIDTTHRVLGMLACCIVVGLALALPQRAAAATPQTAAAPTPAPPTAGRPDGTPTDPLPALIALVAPDAVLTIPAHALDPSAPSTATLSLTTQPRLGRARVTGQSIRYTAPHRVPDALLAQAARESTASSTASAPTVRPVSLGYRLCTKAGAASCSEGSVRVDYHRAVSIAIETGQRVLLRTAELEAPFALDGTTLSVEGTGTDEADSTAVPLEAGADRGGVRLEAGARDGDTALSWRGCTRSGQCVFGAVTVHVVRPLRSVHTTTSARITASGAVLLPTSHGDGRNVPDITSLTVVGTARFVPADAHVRVGALTAVATDGNILVSGLPATEPGTLRLRYRVCSSVNARDCPVSTITATLVPLPAPAQASAGDADAHPASAVHTSGGAPRASGPAAQGLSARGPSSRGPSEPGSSDEGTAAQDSPAQSMSGSIDLTWWVVGGALLFMLGGGATVIGTRKH